MPAGQSKVLLNVVGGLSLPARQVLWLLWSACGAVMLSRQRWRAPGASRLAAAAPIVAANLLVPLLFNGDEEGLANFSVAIATAFITNFKVGGAGRRREVGWSVGAKAAGWQLVSRGDGGRVGRRNCAHFSCFPQGSLLVFAQQAEIGRAHV